MPDLFGFDPAAAVDLPTVNAEFTRADTARLVLRYGWDRSRPAAAFLMNNPSVAGKKGTPFDPTARRTIHFAKMLGAGSAYLVNWCPLIATDPADLWRMLKDHRFDAHLVQANLDCIARAAAAAEWHVVACGPEGFRRAPDLVRRALHAFIGEGSRVVKWQQRPRRREAWCLGVSPEGAPLHPLARGRYAIPNDRQPVRWMLGEWPPQLKPDLPVVYGRT